jgi:hypothetical protein
MPGAAHGLFCFGFTHNPTLLLKQEFLRIVLTLSLIQLCDGLSICEADRAVLPFMVVCYSLLWKNYHDREDSVAQASNLPSFAGLKLLVFDFSFFQGDWLGVSHDMAQKCVTFHHHSLPGNIDLELLLRCL